MYVCSCSCGCMYMSTCAHGAQSVVGCLSLSPIYVLGRGLSVKLPNLASVWANLSWGSLVCVLCWDYERATSAGVSVEAGVQNFSLTLSPWMVFRSLNRDLNPWTGNMRFIKNNPLSLLCLFRNCGLENNDKPVLTASFYANISTSQRKVGADKDRQGLSYLGTRFMSTSHVLRCFRLANFDPVSLFPGQCLGCFWEEGANQQPGTQSQQSLQPAEARDS